jgi:Na+-driven multidrug efflux pump
MAVLGPQADGAGNDLLVGRYLQLGIIFFLLGTIPGMLIWSFLTERAVLWFGFDQETADIGQAYAYPFFAISIFDGLDGCLHEFLDIMDHEKYSTVVQILHFAFQTLALIVLATAGYNDLVAIGIVQAFVALIMTIANFSYVIYKGWLDDYWEGLVLTFSLRVSVPELLLARCTLNLVLSPFRLCRIERRCTRW